MNSEKVNGRGRSEYRALLLGYGRKELLKMTRRMGLTAHTLSDEALVALLWDHARKDVLPETIRQAMADWDGATQAQRDAALASAATLAGRA